MMTIEFFRRRARIVVDGTGMRARGAAVACFELAVGRDASEQERRAIHEAPDFEVEAAVVAVFSAARVEG
jgi:hypothetical protein